jgi:hypothetical protein
MKFVGFEYCVQSVSWLIQKNPSIIVPTGSPINGGNFNLLVGPTGIEPAWCEPMDPKSCVMTVFCRLWTEPMTRMECGQNADG